MPRSWPQLLGSSAVQPPRMGTSVSCPAVEGKLRKSCGGVPTRTMNEDQLPSLPSQNWDGLKEKGAGIVLLLAPMKLALSTSIDGNSGCQSGGGGVA